MEPTDKHNIYGVERHGRRERPLEETQVDDTDLHMEGGIENAAALEDIIGDGIAEATNEERLIDQITARTIARALTHALDDDSPHLDGFARTGVGRRIDIEQEYFELYTDARTPTIVRTWIDWLATFLFNRDYPDVKRDGGLPYDAAAVPEFLVPDSASIGGRVAFLRRPASQTELNRSQMIGRLEPLVSEVGDAFRAYLDLDDVDASQPDLLDKFRSDFAGDFKSVASAIDAVTEIPGWERQLRSWAIERGLEGMVFIDRDKLEQLARETWDIVDYRGRCYVFDK
ncbi:MAG: hypothetical protein JWP19_2249 [Rhodoglobus sp.]|nr:hypothetical protein [Rhodoglobus sp.]